MAGKRKNDDVTGSVAPKKRPAHEELADVKPAAKRSEEEDFPRGNNQLFQSVIAVAAQLISFSIALKAFLVLLIVCD